MNILHQSKTPSRGEIRIDWLILGLILLTLITASMVALARVPGLRETPPYEWAIQRFAPRVIDWACNEASPSGRARLVRDVVGDTHHNLALVCTRD